MRQQRVGKVLSIVILVCITFIILLATILVILAKRTFRYETSINGIDCSFMSVETASKKLEKEMNSATVTLLFADDREYTCLGAFFEIALSNEKSLQEILNEQIIQREDSKAYEQVELYSINEDKVKEYLSSLSVFRESKVRKPQNAYLEWNEKNLLYIEPEVYGNEINYEEACNFMISALKKGETTIDFRKISNINPERRATDEDLISQMNDINSVLSTTINYTWDDCTYTLDAKVMKDWVYEDEEGNYGIDIENNLPNFVDELNKKARYLLTSTNFNATDLGKISVSFGRKTYANIDKEKEIERIKEQLGKAKKVDFEPIYAALPNYTNIDTYVEVDLTRQNVWMYVNGKCIVNTKCVTGNVAGGYATPAGIYYLTYKTTDTYLKGYNSDGSKYNSHVNFWMPFNGGIGFHDALWRSRFGGNIYMTNGSHGCINLPYNAKKTIYHNINTSIPIILYAS